MILVAKELIFLPNIGSFQHKKTASYSEAVLDCDSVVLTMSVLKISVLKISD
ncbi:hypothetical protein MAH2_20150 [Sessilibacter sp. MAH2]